jgi:hypothetical protein
VTWAPVNDTQTPGWGGVAVDVFTAFQLGAFQFPGFQIGTTVSNVWTPVDDSETPDWGPIPT